MDTWHNTGYISRLKCCPNCMRLAARWRPKKDIGTKRKLRLSSFQWRSGLGMGYSTSPSHSISPIYPGMGFLHPNLSLEQFVTIFLVKSWKVDFFFKIRNDQKLDPAHQNPFGNHKTITSLRTASQWCIYVYGLNFQKCYIFNCKGQSHKSRKSHKSLWWD